MQGKQIVDVMGVFVWQTFCGLSLCCWSSVAFGINQASYLQSRSGLPHVALISNIFQSNKFIISIINFTLDQVKIFSTAEFR